MALASSSRGGPAVHACPMHSDLGLGVGGKHCALPAACAEGEGVRCQHPGGPGAPELDCLLWRRLVPRSPQALPLLKGRLQPRKYWKRQGAALFTTALQDLTPGQERWPGLRDAGPGISTPVQVPPLHAGACPGRGLPCLPSPRSALSQHGRHPVVLVPSSHVPPGAARTPDFHQEKNEGASGRF